MGEISSQRPTWAEVNLDNLTFNFESSKRFVGSDLKYMAVVKADAYGHGAVRCAKRLEAAGADWFGVALPEEGVELRRAGIRKLILCLGGFWDGQAEVALNYQLTPVVYQIERARVLNDAATRRGTAVAVHVKVDTGMGRIGVRHDAIAEFAEELRKLDHLRLEGVMTHFAAADDLSQTDFTHTQIDRFHTAVDTFRGKGFHPSYLDLANSPGAVAHPSSRGNMVRLGGVLYGLGGDVLPGGIDKPELRPVLSLHTRVAHLKRVPAGETIGYGRTFEAKTDSTIATIPIGYQDGFSRSLSNAGRGIVRGKFAPVAGRVSMDWTTLDVTAIEDVEVGDQVVLIGEQDGLQIAAEDLAAAEGTISYEVTCSIDRRVPRIYTDSTDDP
ncbi:MAG TPA: alanine racemase [Pyrinomonadaceae bacterium]|nr:alanine racemase [Pyrinomonadaceae bacterium]